jgi:hypothetical protein
VPTFFLCILFKYLTDNPLHPTKRLCLQRRGNPEGNICFVKQSKLQSTDNSAHWCNLRVGDFSTRKKSNSRLTKHTRPLLTTCVLVLKILKVILVLYEQFNELSSSLGSRQDRNMSACKRCIGCFMKSELAQHVRSSVRKKNKQLSYSKKQMLVTQTQQSSTSRNFKNMCIWMVSANIPYFKFQIPNFGPFSKSTASNIFQTTQN